MTKNMISKVRAGFANLREDERGAESSEVILVLVLLVVGLMGAWRVLKNQITKSATNTSNCIATASTATTNCK